MNPFNFVADVIPRIISFIDSQHDHGAPERGGPIDAASHTHAASGVPTGGILAYGASAAPSGYLLCDGAAVSRSTYAALFAVIGTTYGVGDGSTTFNMPDLRGRPPVGVGTHADVSALANSDGVAVGSRTPKHTHTGPSHTHPQNLGSVLNNADDAGTKHWIRNTSATGSGESIVHYTDNPSGGAAGTPILDGVSAAGTGVSGSANGGYLVVQFIIKT